MVCQFCLFFSKNQLLALLIFAMVSLVSFAFISALIFKISSLLLTLGFAILISEFVFYHWNLRWKNWAFWVTLCVCLSLSRGSGNTRRSPLFPALFPRGWQGAGWPPTHEGHLTRVTVGLTPIFLLSWWEPPAAQSCGAGSWVASQVSVYPRPVPLSHHAVSDLSLVQCLVIRLK